MPDACPVSGRPFVAGSHSAVAVEEQHLRKQQTLASQAANSSTNHAATDPSHASVSVTFKLQHSGHVPGDPESYNHLPVHEVHESTAPI